MKLYKKFIVAFFLILLISCALGSILKIPIDSFVEKSEGFADMVNYKNGMYNYGKIMRRIIMIVLFATVFLFRKKLDFIPLAVSGFKSSLNRHKDISMGLIIGAGSLLVYGIITLILGIQYFDADTPSLSRLFSKPLTYFLSACLIGIFEETLFRGFIFQGLLKDFSVSTAVIFSSLFYAILHFFSFKVSVYPGPDMFVGFSSMAGFFSHAFSDTFFVLQYIIGLFIVGAVLSISFYHTKSLYLPIGLHAGWVFGLKMNSFLLDHNHKMSEFFFGDGHIISGLYGWLFLLGVLAIIKMIIARPET